MKRHMLVVVALVLLAAVVGARAFYCHSMGQRLTRAPGRLLRLPRHAVLHHQHVVGRHDGRPVQLEADLRESAHARAGRDDGVLEGERVLLAILARHLEALDAGPRERLELRDERLRVLGPHLSRVEPRLVACGLGVPGGVDSDVENGSDAGDDGGQAPEGSVVNGGNDVMRDTVTTESGAPLSEQWPALASIPPWPRALPMHD